MQLALMGRADATLLRRHLTRKTNFTSCSGFLVAFVNISRV